ncbi:alpha/beta hydrolase family protein [Falsiroseomonas sp. HW251]|uniref:alpha/beta hydrolase family protein n=1 Tax=Falsiroseomonas sp. HW251 TaxID=3390998 RepID=UPI003D313EF3
MRRRFLLAGIAAGAAGPARAQVGAALPAAPPAPAPLPPGPLPLESYDFLVERRARPTRLIRPRASPQPWTREPVPAGAERIAYRAAGRTLWGLLGLPARAPGARAAPALVYAHGGFAFANSDFEWLRFLIERGWAVFTPTWRGENGNPGFFEFMFGEVDDLASAVRRLTEEPAVDRNRIHVFGHSVGGGLCDLLALFNDLPIRASGSAGGLYFPDDITADPRNPLFPPDDIWERRLRTMVPSARQLVRRHLAVLGSEERLAPQVEAMNDQARAAASRLTVAVVPGDHQTALRPALDFFLARVEAGDV